MRILLSLILCFVSFINSIDASRAYITNSSSNDVSVIDTDTNQVIATVKVGLTPAYVAITPDGSRAYVTNGGSGTVSVINTISNKVIATIPVGISPFWI